MSSFFKGHNPIKGIAKSMNKVSDFVSTSLAPNPIKGIYDIYVNIDSSISYKIYRLDESYALYCFTYLSF